MALFAGDTLFVALGQSKEGTAVGTKEQRPWYQRSVMDPSLGRRTCQSCVQALACPWHAQLSCVNVHPLTASR